MTQAPDPDIAELSRLERDITVLVQRADYARQAWATAEQILADTRHRRDEVAYGLHLRAEAAEAARAAGAGEDAWAASETPAPGTTPEPAAMPAGRTPEASTRTFQNVLFILGGLLLCTAAVVFTAVAWATYGVGGRATILGIATALALSAPLVALWRRLRATAETFAGVGLVLVALDGYAAWYVNLFGVNALPGTRYAGLVCAVTAAVAAGYGLLTRLVGPGFVAVVVIQPALPLFAAEFDLDAVGWSLLATSLAVLNLGIAWRAARTRSAVAVAHQAIGWMLAASWWLVSGLATLGALIVADNAAQAARAGLVTLLVAGTLGLAAAVSRLRALSTVAGAAMVLAAVAGGLRFVVVAWPESTVVLVAVVITAVALLLLAVRPLIPVAARPGAVVAIALCGSLFAVVLTGSTLIAATDTIGHAQPLWHAALVNPLRFDWQLLAALGLVAVAAWATVPELVRLGERLMGNRQGGTSAVRAGQVQVLVLFASLAVLAIPGAVALQWWAPSAMDTLAAAALVAVAMRARSWPLAFAPALAAPVLAGHGVLSSLARPANTAAILFAFVSVGIAAAALTGHRSAAEPEADLEDEVEDDVEDEVEDEVEADIEADIEAEPESDIEADPDANQDAHADQQAPEGVGTRPPAIAWMVAGSALAVGLVALAPAVGSALVAATLPAWWVARLTCASVLLVLAGLAITHVIRPRLRGYAFAAVLVSAMVWPTVAAVNGNDPIGIYAGVAFVLLAAALLPKPAPRTQALTWAVVAAGPAAVLFAVDVVPAALAVVALPYGWFDAIWYGAPGGVGLTPATVFGQVTGGYATSTYAATGVRAVALGLLAVASATAIYATTRRVRPALGGLGIGGPTAILVALVAAGARWPIVPAVSLLLGLLILGVVAIVQVGQWRTAIGGIQAAAYVGAGLSGALSTRWSTLVALGSIVVAGAVVGAIGRDVNWRVGGWLTSVIGALATAATAGLAADLRLRDASWGVLAVAVLALALGAALHRTRERESTAVQAAAHAGALFALVFTGGYAGHSATVSSLWGIAVGLRALWPGTSREGRATMAAVAAGWQLIAWWLLLAARDVTLVEAYTLPLAAVALLAGWAALRNRTDLRSWIAYGPALTAAFLPSLALVLAPASDNSVWRRLLLGVGALAVVFTGSLRRRQAPVVVGGIVVGIVALHEIALVWDLLPRWIPLALGGLLLVGLAITYERRRRDVAWLRATLGRMQ